MESKSLVAENTIIKPISKSLAVSEFSLNIFIDTLCAY